MSTTEHTGHSRDLAAAGIAALLVAAAVVVGTSIEHADGTLHLNWPPLYARWDPHIGPGTPAALIVAVAVIAYAPALAARLPWRPLLLTAWAASMAWIWSLALIDGWHRGVARRLTTKYEYLQVIDRFEDIPATLRDFTRHILIDSPGHWPAHTAGHPPGATLTFVLLDRVGLGGGAWAGAFCVTAGSTAVVAVLITLRALADEATARRAAPFLVLAPAAIWVGASADGYFAAVTAWMIALLALAATRTVRSPAAAALGAGLLFGLTCYLSYGLTLFALVAAAVLLITRTLRPLPLVLAGTAVVPLAFTLAGFNWWEAYHLLVERYHQGAGGIRPYGYFVWANLACTVLVVGLATVAGLRRTLASAPGAISRLRTGRTNPADRLAVLVLAALLALVAADLSGMSKAETERIWLPFATFLLAATALLPTAGRRHWLAAQAVLALAVNHLLFTGW
ncbi:glycosyltransferase family 39 protein [Streptomyces rectiviolaceus]|uniref:Glycosyltransferase family 39 protein n=1 Tax=Streptomyces rectiviolaceus TaxID=332591 RepID=A0ABP6NJA4_9ACTN